MFWSHGKKWERNSKKNILYTEGQKVAEELEEENYEKDETTDNVDSVTKNICNTCFKLFNSKKLLNQHKGIHEDRSKKCDQCEKVFSNEVSLKVHINSVHSTTIENCEICPKTFSCNKTV